MSIIQFESIFEKRRIIRIPEEYENAMHLGTKVTVLSHNNQRRLGSLQNKGSVTFENDFYMTAEEFAN
jgi:hypothetical protein